MIGHVWYDLQAVKYKQIYTFEQFYGTVMKSESEK